MSNAAGLDDALSRLVSVIEGGSSAGVRTPAPTPPGKPGSGPISTPPAGGGIGGGEPPLTRADIARLQLYLQGMPILTPEKVDELERSLPELIEMLESLGYKAGLKREVTTTIELGKSTERSAGDDAGFNEFVAALQNDLSAGGERVVPAIAIGLFMAAYTIVHQWRA